MADPWYSKGAVLGCTLLIAGVAAFLALYVPGLDAVFGLTGSCSATLLCLFLPSVVILQGAKQGIAVSQMEQLCAYMYITISIFVGVGCTIYICTDF